MAGGRWVHPLLEGLGQLPTHPANSSHSLEPEDLDPDPTPPGPSSEGDSAEPEAEEAVPAEGETEGEAVLMEEDLIQQSLDDYDAGKYSPRLLTAHELPLDAHVLEPDEDLQRLQLSRQQLQVTGASPDWRGGAAKGAVTGRGQREGRDQLGWLMMPSLLSLSDHPLITCLLIHSFIWAQ